MAIDKKQIQNIKTNIERTIQGLVAKPKEFTYKETGGFVRNKMTYSIYYTLNKDEVYLTGTTDSTNSQIIEKVNDKTMFSEYKDLASLTRTPYPKTTPAKPTDNDYEIGQIRRYFTQLANDETKPIFEISQEDFSNPNISLSYPLKQARENFEKNYLLSQLKKNKGNISKTAEFIGMERSALHRKLKSLGIKGIN